MNEALSVACRKEKGSCWQFNCTFVLSLIIIKAWIMNCTRFAQTTRTEHAGLYSVNDGDSGPSGDATNSTLSVGLDTQCLWTDAGDVRAFDQWEKGRTPISYTCEMHHIIHFSLWLTVMWIAISKWIETKKNSLCNLSRYFHKNEWSYNCLFSFFSYINLSILKFQ